MGQCEVNGHGVGRSEVPQNALLRSVWGRVRSRFRAVGHADLQSIHRTLANTCVIPSMADCGLQRIGTRQVLGRIGDCTPGFGRLKDPSASTSFSNEPIDVRLKGAPCRPPKQTAVGRRLMGPDRLMGPTALGSLRPPSSSRQSGAVLGCFWRSEALLATS